jgi:CRISPR-associated protein Cmr2
MTIHWRDVLVAYLHDPPDKALDIRGHERRARRYAQAALGDTVSEAELKDWSDPLAAIAERLPSPHWQTVLVPCEDNRLEARHPLSGQKETLRVTAPPEEQIERRIGQLVESQNDTQKRFLAVWRRLQECLAGEYGEWFSRLPADTRVPDHTIWHHLDTTAALRAAGAGDAAFLSFSLGPVQSFIAAAQSIRDLWSGSMILAWLTFRAMLPVVDALGPTALVYPALRGLPWLDEWLRSKKGLEEIVDGPSAEACLTPCIPNRFLALVPSGRDGEAASELAKRCRLAAREAWMEIAQDVRRNLEKKWNGFSEDWAARWDDQVADFFDFRASVLPWRAAGTDEEIGRLIAGDGGFQAAFPDASKVRALADAIPEDQCPRWRKKNQPYEQKSAGSWQAKVELSARLMEAQRAIRHVPPSTKSMGPQNRFPAKCSLLGSYEQMGPADFGEARDFWEAAATTSIDGVRLRKQERLCAVSLVKRFSGPCFFQDRLKVTRDDLRYDDTATVAAAGWLEKRPALQAYSQEQHGSQWLHWSSPTQGCDDGDPEVPAKIWCELLAERAKERPPAYYAVLMIDGDHLGKWLRGEKSPRVRDIMHPKMVEYYRTLDERTDDGRHRQTLVDEALNARRPVGPALHAAISEALANFALHFVPEIVRDHNGTLIYAGGDDVLALVPTSEALKCAVALRDTFRREWKTDALGRERLLMGHEATLSAGMAVVHYKEDLRFALQTARDAERAAKNAGRDILQTVACRRSGEHARALCPWGFVPDIQHLIRAFLPGENGELPASDRWAYRLRGELSTLKGLPREAMRAEIRRLVERSEKPTRQRLDQPGNPQAGQRIADSFDRYFELREMRYTDSNSDVPLDQEQPGAFLNDFVTLCQSASFFARGRDQ